MPTCFGRPTVFLISKYYRVILTRSQKNCTFLVLPLSFVLGCHGRTIQCTSNIAFVSFAYEDASYELVLTFGAILIFHFHEKLVVPVRAVHSKAP